MKLYICHKILCVCAPKVSLNSRLRRR